MIWTFQHQIYRCTQLEQSEQTAISSVTIGGPLLFPYLLYLQSGKLLPMENIFSKLAVTRHQYMRFCYDNQSASFNKNILMFYDIFWFYSWLLSLKFLIHGVKNKKSFRKILLSRNGCLPQPSGDFWLSNLGLFLFPSVIATKRNYLAQNLIIKCLLLPYGNYSYSSLSHGLLQE